MEPDDAQRYQAAWRGYRRQFWSAFAIQSFGLLLVATVAASASFLGGKLIVAGAVMLVLLWLRGVRDARRLAKFQCPACHMVFDRTGGERIRCAHCGLVKYAAPRVPQADKPVERLSL